MIENLWSLPGPSRLAATLGDALSGGGSCALVAPVSLRQRGDWVAGAAEAADVYVDFLDVDVTRPPAAVFADLAGVEWARGADAARMLAEDEFFAGRTLGLVLPAYAPDWGMFIAEFLTALPSIADRLRPQLLVCCGPEDLAAFRKRGLPVTVRWWWGALSRIDTSVATTRALGTEADPVTVASITEICGFDLDFAETLAHRWDGTLDRLVTLVERDAGPIADVVEETTFSAVSLGATPPTRLRDPWDLGVIDAWERYRPFVSPRAIPADERVERLRGRLWRGQLRELMPLVDEERARLETWARSVSPEVRNISPPIEIGYLVKLLREEPRLRSRSSSERQRAGRWLRDTRNLLAHRETVTPAHIREGYELLDGDRLGGAAR